MMGDMTQSENDITVVHVMRHGEVENPEGVLYGRLPGYHLSELGRRMADRVAEHLAERDITHVVASPLERAQEAAEPIGKAHGLDVAVDERLIEAANAFQGKTFGVGDGPLRRPATSGPPTHPLPTPLGGAALQCPGGAAEGGAGRCARGRPGGRGGLRQPSAADLDRAQLRGAAAA